MITSLIVSSSMKLLSLCYNIAQVEILDIESRITEVVIETDRHSSSEQPTKITRIAKDVNDRAVLTVSHLQKFNHFIYN